METFSLLRQKQLSGHRSAKTGRRHSTAICVEEAAVQEVQKCRGDFDVQEVCMETQGKPQSQQHRAQ